MTDLMKLGHAVKELRRRLQCSQQALAIEMIVCLRTVSIYEAGKTSGSLPVLARLTRIAEQNGFPDLAKTFEEKQGKAWKTPRTALLSNYPIKDLSMTTDEQTIDMAANDVAVAALHLQKACSTLRSLSAEPLIVRMASRAFEEVTDLLTIMQLPAADPKKSYHD